MSDLNIPPPTPLPTGGEHNPLASMRATIEAKDAEVKSLAARLQALEAEKAENEKAKLDELSRLKLEVEESRQLRDQHGKFTTKLTEMYEAELKAIPDGVRAKIEKFVTSTDPSERLEQLQNAKELAALAPNPVGTVTITQTGRQQPAAPQMTEKEAFQQGVGTYFNRPETQARLKAVQDEIRTGARV